MRAAAHPRHACSLMREHALLKRTAWRVTRRSGWVVRRGGNVPWSSWGLTPLRQWTPCMRGRQVRAGSRQSRQERRLGEGDGGEEEILAEGEYNASSGGSSGISTMPAGAAHVANMAQRQDWKHWLTGQLPPPPQPFFLHDSFLYFPPAATHRCRCWGCRTRP